MSMLVRRKVTVKAVMTPSLRKEMLTNIDALILQTKKEIELLEKEIRKILFVPEAQLGAEGLRLKALMEAEKREKEKIYRELEKQRKEIEDKADGEEVVYSVIEGFADIKVGDNLLKKVEGGEIVIKDGEVIEIRNE